ncbi:MAG: hypothetical protein RR705_08670 [Lachnospiraceae bacterium]
MRQYKTKEVKAVEKIFCNQCGKEIPVANGQPEQGVFSVDYEWGYFSNKDGEKHSFDLCEECYDKMIAGFLTPASGTK